MKQKLILIGIGLLPFLLGLGSSLLFALPLPFFLTNLLFFMLWVWLCFRFCDPARRVLPQFLLTCIPGAVIQALALWQELIPGSDLPGIVISASQFYFLSGVHLAGRILTPFLRTITAWPYCITDYILLSLLCFLSMGLKKKINQGGL